MNSADSLESLRGMLAEARLRHQENARAEFDAREHLSRVEARRVSSEAEVAKLAHEIDLLERRAEQQRRLRAYAEAGTAARKAGQKAGEGFSQLAATLGEEGRA